jgi:hypothetical protein
MVKTCNKASVGNVWRKASTASRGTALPLGTRKTWSPPWAPPSTMPCCRRHAAGWRIIDAYATESNGRAARYWSRYGEPGAEAIDALSVGNWPQSLCPICAAWHQEVLFAGDRHEGDCGPGTVRPAGAGLHPLALLAQAPYRLRPSSAGLSGGLPPDPSRSPGSCMLAPTLPLSSPSLPATSGSFLRATVCRRWPRAVRAPSSGGPAHLVVLPATWLIGCC